MQSTFENNNLTETTQNTVLPTTGALPTEHKALEAGDNGEVVANTQYIQFLDEQIADIENNTERLRHLLQKHAKTLEHEGLRRETDLLLSWMVQSSAGLRTARHLFAEGPVWLNEVHQRVKLAKEEFSRMEDEGGNPGPRTNETKDLREVWTGVHDILASLEGAIARPQKLTDFAGDELTLLA